jgi:multimeric flavodoxin WrbA
MKNIIVITGSSRKNGNSELLAKAFIEGATEAGHKVTFFEAAKKRITGCIACDTCFSTGNACSLMDDFNELARQMENADAIVFCTPLYWFTFPAQIKSVIDKMHSFFVGKKQLKIKEAVLIVCSAIDDIKCFDGILKTYELILNHLGWKDAGKLLVPNINKIGDVKNTDGLGKAKILGTHI